jgi:hypothetical protein
MMSFEVPFEGSVNEVISKVAFDGWCCDCAGDLQGSRRLHIISVSRCRAC